MVLGFLGSIDAVSDGNIFGPEDGTGSKMAAFKVRVAMLAHEHFIEIELKGNRLDDAGRFRVKRRVANLLPYAVLKIFAFQYRQNKDTSDLVFTPAQGLSIRGCASAGQAVSGGEGGDGQALTSAADVRDSWTPSTEVNQGPVRAARDRATSTVNPQE